MTLDDVYRLTEAKAQRTFDTLLILTALMALFVLASVVIWHKVTNLLRRTNVILGIAEQHGWMTDNQTARAEVIAEQVKEVAKSFPNHGAENHIISEVKQIPAKTADEVMQKMKDTGSSVTIAPPATPPPGTNHK